MSPYSLSIVALGFLFLQSLPVASESPDYTKLSLVGVLAMAVVALWRTNEKKDRMLIETNEKKSQALLDVTTAVTRAVAEQTAAMLELKTALDGHLGTMIEMHKENRERLEDLQNNCVRCGNRKP